MSDRHGEVPPVPRAASAGESAGRGSMRKEGITQMEPDSTAKWAHDLIADLDAALAEGGENVRCSHSPPESVLKQLRRDWQEHMGCPAGELLTSYADGTV